MPRGSPIPRILEELKIGERTAVVLAEDTGLKLPVVKTALRRAMERGKVTRRPAPEHREHRKGQHPYLYRAAG